MLRLVTMLLVVGAALTVIGSCATLRPTLGQANSKARCRDGGLGSWYLAVDFWPDSGFEPEAMCLDNPDSGIPPDAGITFTSHCKTGIQITLSGDGINPDGGNLFKSNNLTDTQSFTHYTHGGMVAGKTYDFSSTACGGSGETGLNGTIEVASDGTNGPPNQK